MQHYVGLDVSMKKTSACIVDESGKIVHESEVKTDPVENNGDLPDFYENESLVLHAIREQGP